MSGTCKTDIIREIVIISDTCGTVQPGFTSFYPRSVEVNHAGLWIRRRRFESARGYWVLCAGTRG